MEAMKSLQEEKESDKRARTVAGLVNSIETLEGGGFLVRRPFPKASFSEFDPILLLDEMGPLTLAPGQAKGAPDHPHRGFETVTYLLSGEMEHKDSRGHAGRLRAGAVQWMTAGAGVVHSEMPSAEFQRTGGRLHGFQLWVNLPKARNGEPALPGNLRLANPQSDFGRWAGDGECDRGRSYGRGGRHRDAHANHLPALQDRARRRGHPTSARRL